MLHRDLKPSNLVIDGGGRARITDFGVAIVVLSGGQEEIGADLAGAGTPSYMAPEVRAGGKASVRSDLYALGLVLYELFTGQRALPPTAEAEMSAARGFTPFFFAVPGVRCSMHSTITWPSESWLSRRVWSSACESGYTSRRLL